MSIADGFILGMNYFYRPSLMKQLRAVNNYPKIQKMFRVLSDVNMINEWAPTSMIPPTAIIFHISRCGSTLLSQLLALDPSNIVLSEVPFFDELLRKGHRDQNEKEVHKWFKAAIQFYGIKRNNEQQHLFIKADSWHVHFYNQIRECYPDTPIILLYRRPDEVLASNQKKRGMQGVQGVVEPSLFGFDQSIFHMPIDEYMAKVLETFFSAYIEILKTDKKALAVNYNEGMLTVTKRIADFTGYSISEEIMQQMKKRAGFHAKYPEQVFGEEKVVEEIPAYLNKAFELYNQVIRL